MNLVGASRLHYDILEKLGEGGMGVVYRALDTKLKREVAIKFLPWHIASNPDMRTRFQIEAQAVATLNHPNITTIYAIEEVEDPNNLSEIFFVMEYVDGIELKQKIKQEPLSLVEAVDIALQVAEGMQAAHEKGITHRDIKPANIMLTSKGRVKLMDFGLAKIGPGLQLTKTNATLGTVAYMSPEQARGETVDHRSDIWSFGVVLYEMLAGARPFTEYHEHALIYAIINSEPSPLPSYDEDIPQPLVEIVESALKKNPVERYQDMHDLTRDLHRYADELFSTAKAVSKDSRAGISRTRHLRSDSRSGEIGTVEAAPSIASEPRSISKSLRYAALGLVGILSLGGVAWWYTASEKSLPTSLDNSISENRVDPDFEQSPGQGDTAPLSSLDIPATENPETQEEERQEEDQDDAATPVESEAAEPPPPAAQAPGEVSSPATETAPLDPSENTVDPDSDVDVEAERQRAIEERSAMIEAERRVPGDEAFKRQLPSYISAQQARQAGQNQFDSLDFEQATSQFQSAEAAYSMAREEAIARFQEPADDARTAMNGSKSRISAPNPEFEEYEQAIAKEGDGDRAYAVGEFEQAAGLYSEAQSLFDQTANRIAIEAEKERQLEAFTADTKRRLADGFESRDITHLESVVVLSDSDRETWTTFFSIFRNFQLGFVDEDRREIDDTHYRLTLTSVLTYTNNENREAMIDITLSGMLEYQNDRWTASKFDMNFNNR